MVDPAQGAGGRTGGIMSSLDNILDKGKGK